MGQMNYFVQLKIKQMYSIANNFENQIYFYRHYHNFYFLNIFIISYLIIKFNQLHQQLNISIQVLHQNGKVVKDNDLTQIIFVEFCQHYNNLQCIKCQYPFVYNSIIQICEIKLEYLIHYDSLSNQDYIQPLLEFCRIQYLETCIECYNYFQLDYLNNSCQPICGDNRLNGKEECEDNNSLFFDGCYNCKYQCHDSCINCKFGKCYQCKQDLILLDYKYCQTKTICNAIEGYYLNEETNTCIENCGDTIISKNEDCDDGNDIQYDGCYQCKYQCQNYCSDCVKGICIIKPVPCSIGLYFNFESLSCESICGDGILIEPQEECDDGNQNQEDECNNNCQLQCDPKCSICEKLNNCLICKKNYQLINKKCEENNYLDHYIINCKIVIDNQCLQCENGFTLQNNNCISYCGDGIQNEKELCDDGNNINGDGCDINCNPSQDSYCRNSELLNLFFLMNFLVYNMQNQFILKI
ncbi:unnamed protein product [Paramecium sonneborni]|uniref:Uncharacterized protein n=1 Tax=Paramecium sonneborni TaxID=65129 RepID=A0A8S1LR51_9CILI|nr:unnamed protein product [Paramecium sonneborni]